MKIFDIRDEYLETSVGTLLYYEKEKAFITELKDHLDEWTAPFLFSGFVKKGIYTIPEEDSMIWVRERIIPSERQNINSILDNHHLKEYDEAKFLELSEGHCSQDELYVKKIDHLPDYVCERMKHNISECFITGEKCIICFFNDNTIKKFNPEDLKKIDRFDIILRNEKLFNSVRVGCGGYSISFDTALDIPAHILYNIKTDNKLLPTDFIFFINNNVFDTSEIGSLLECSRQNISYMIKQDKLSPVKDGVKGNLYLKGDVIKNTW